MPVVRHSKSRLVEYRFSLHEAVTTPTVLRNCLWRNYFACPYKEAVLVVLARLLICLSVLLPLSAYAAPPAQFVHNTKVGIGLTQSGATLQDSYWARDEKHSWHQVLGAANSAMLAERGSADGAIQTGRTSLYAAPPVLNVNRFEQISTTAVLLLGNDSGWNIRKEITLRENAVHVDIALSSTVAESRLEYALSSHAFLPDGAKLSTYHLPDMLFAPALRKGADQVIGEHFFRAPAVMLQEGRIFAALVPDLQILAVDHPAQAIIDLDGENGIADAPLLSYGFCRHRLSGHVTFTHRPGETMRAPKRLHFAYDLILRADAPELLKPATLHGSPVSQSAFDATAQKLWQEYGYANLQKILPQTMPFAEYANVCYPAAFAEVEKGKQLGWWEELPVASQPWYGGPAVIATPARGGVYAGWGYQDGNTSWQGWFNNLRSAYGMYIWGKRLGNADWIHKSQLMLNMALSAPIKEGAFPTVYNHMKLKWQGCLVSPPDSNSYYCSADMAWKGYWLLRWYGDIQLVDADARTSAAQSGYGIDEMLKQCRQLGDFFLAHQLPNGAIPSWFKEDLTTVSVLEASAQTALPAWFLAELADKTSDTRYLAAAKRAGAFVASDVIPQFRYYDFETFFSCSPKECVAGGRNDNAMRDPHTMQLPQNTLCMQWSAEALKRLWELTGDSTYLRSAIQALDVMIMYQNVWNIPYRTTANSFGGFGVQNSDGEYNDARQAQFACTLCDFGAALHRQDYFERGVAALRGSLTLINHPSHIANGVYPEPNYAPGLEPENFGHRGADSHEGRTGFDWGEGSGLAAAAYIMQRYGGAYADLKAGWACGIDGVNAALAGNELKVENQLSALQSPYLGQYSIEVQCSGGCASYVNGKRYIPGEPITPIKPQAPVKPAEVLHNPTWDFENGELPGWTVAGNFVDLPTRSTRTQFHKSGHWFIGTGEDGEGGWDDSCTGIILSPRFTTDKSRMVMKVGGGDSDGVSVALLGANNVPLRTARGHKKERLETLTWDVQELNGQELVIKITDNDPAPWGHINIDDIHFED